MSERYKIHALIQFECTKNLISIIVMLFVVIINKAFHLFVCCLLGFSFGKRGTVSLLMKKFSSLNWINLKAFS